MLDLWLFGSLPRRVLFVRSGRIGEVDSPVLTIRLCCYYYDYYYRHKEIILKFLLNLHNNILNKSKCERTKMTSRTFERSHTQIKEKHYVSEEKAVRQQRLRHQQQQQQRQRKKH